MGKQQLSRIQRLGNWLMLAKNNIKILYSQEGYLPNYPPHLISDEEMFDAFLNNDFAYFKDYYPLKNNNLQIQYETLLNAFRYHFARLFSSVESFREDLPDWVYSYMLGEVVTDSSIQEDRHYLLVGLGKDNIDDEITSESQLQCYVFSSNWVNKLNKTLRKANLGTLLKDYELDEQQLIVSDFEKFGVVFNESGDIDTRPPSMYGEPHVIKLIRLNEVS